MSLSCAREPPHCSSTPFLWCVAHYAGYRELRRCQMCRILNSILAVTAAGGLSGAALSSYRSPSIEGVWQAVEVTTTGPGARTIRPVAPNLSIITATVSYTHLRAHET